VNAAGGMLPDALTRFVFEHAAVRGAVVALPNTARTVLAAHPYPPALQRVLAELLAASALLGSTLKFSGSLIVQLQGDGPVRLLVVECTDTLDLRATAQWNAERTLALGDDASLADLAGGPEHGRLVITLDPRGAGTIYQGIVTLESGSVAGLIEHYLVTSEQLASRIVLATSETGTSGVIAQRLPGATAEDNATWQRAREALDALPTKTLLAPATPAELLTTIFPYDDIRMFKPQPARFGCSCSAARVENALRIAGSQEVEAILAERNDVEVTCEFCNRRYSFTPTEARALFGPGPSPTQH
jgi:molecular chaperone Hsp33